MFTCVLPAEAALRGSAGHLRRQPCALAGAHAVACISSEVALRPRGRRSYRHAVAWLCGQPSEAVLRPSRAPLSQARISGCLCGPPELALRPCGRRSYGHAVACICGQPLEAALRPSRAPLAQTQKRLSLRAAFGSSTAPTHAPLARRSVCLCGPHTEAALRLRGRLSRQHAVARLRAAYGAAPRPRGRFSRRHAVARVICVLPTEAALRVSLRATPSRVPLVPARSSVYLRSCLSEAALRPSGRRSRRNAVACVPEGRLRRYHCALAGVARNGTQ